MDENKKQVFISYSRKDYLDSYNQIIPDNAISKILDAFNNAAISYWIDEKGVYSGDEYVPLISKAIKACDIFLFISSEASNSSDWTSNEIAAANMYKKKIIPFRLDESTYNDSIIMFIAKLDFIEYFKNPEKAISRLVRSVSEYLKEVDIARKKQEQEKEAAKKKREQEQKKLIGDIELTAAELDNDERNAELKRRRLINSVQNVEDENERNRLMELIENSGSLYKRYKEEIQQLTNDLKVKEEASLKALSDLNKIQEESQNREKGNTAHSNDNQEKPPFLRHVNGYTFIITFLILVIIILLFGHPFAGKLDTQPQDNVTKADSMLVLTTEKEAIATDRSSYNDKLDTITTGQEEHVKKHDVGKKSDDSANQQSESVNIEKIYSLNEVDEKPRMNGHVSKDITVWFNENLARESVVREVRNFRYSFVVYQDGSIKLEDISNYILPINISRAKLQACVQTVMDRYQSQVIPGKKNGKNVSVRCRSVINIPVNSEF